MHILSDGKTSAHIKFLHFSIPIPVTFPPLEMSITITDVEWWTVDQPAINEEATGKNHHHLPERKYLKQQ